MTETKPVKRASRQRFFRNDSIGIALINERVDTSKARVLVKYPGLGSIYVEYFEPGASPNAYQTWLALPKGTLAAMRNAGETRPIYNHCFVDRL